MLIAALKWANERPYERIDELLGHEADDLARLGTLLELSIPYGPAREEWVFFLELWGWILHRPELIADGATLDSRWRGYFVEIVRSGTANGVFRPVAPPEEAADRLVAVVDGLGLKAVLGQPWMTPERMRALLIRFAADELQVSHRRSNAPPRSARRRPRARARPGVRRRRPRGASTPAGGRARASPTHGPGAAKRGRLRGAGEGPARARTPPPAGGRSHRRPRARAVRRVPLCPPEHRNRLARGRRVGEPGRPDPLAGRQLLGFPGQPTGPFTPARRRRNAPSRRGGKGPDRGDQRGWARGEESDPPHAGRYYHRPVTRATRSERPRKEAGVLETLFSPLRVGPSSSRIRIVSTAHQTTLVHEHLPTVDFVAYHEARARGGTGLIVLEAAVHPSGLLTPHTLAGYREEIVPALARRRGSARARDTALRAALPRRTEQISSPLARPRSLRRRSRASASTSSRARSRRGDRLHRRGVRKVGGAGRPGRPRRDRDLGRARVPRRAVLHARAEPA